MTILSLLVFVVGALFVIHRSVKLGVMFAHKQGTWTVGDSLISAIAVTMCIASVAGVDLRFM